MITRFQIIKVRKKCLRYFSHNRKLGKKSSIYIHTRDILRTSNFTLDYNHALKILWCIEFIYNNVEQHWAETDGQTIWLNTYKTFSDELLETTLLHEAFHGLVRRNAPPPSEYVLFIPEEKEHKIMSKINPLLI